MKLTKTLSIVVFFFGLLSRAGAQTPTITGVNAFWWLGSGILSNGGTCSGQTGPCYYSQASWTANPNGNTGSPTWTVVNSATGGGAVSLDCYSCTTVEATATAPSSGCVYDITVTVSYNGNTSAPFTVAIIKPSMTTLQSGYPLDQSANVAYSTTGYVGFVTTTNWNVTDTCGASDGGFDVNEVFDTFTNDTANNWGTPAAGNGYISGSIAHDYIALVASAIGNPTSPPVQNPQSPLSSNKIYHDYPWELFVFSQTSGQGDIVRSDKQQWYQDHGRHE